MHQHDLKFFRVSVVVLISTFYAFNALGRFTNAGELEPFEKVAKEYNIEIIAANGPFQVSVVTGLIDGKEANHRLLESYAGLFVPEFTLYPPALISRVGLKRVVLCERLSYDGQPRAAIPDFVHHRLYLDVKLARTGTTYLRKVLHHEFFHIIDLRDDGRLYSDDRWLLLNPNSFKYGDGGQNAQHLSSTSRLTNEFPGFLNHYSTTGVEEDKAEIFANMMVDPEYIAKRVNDDRVLSTKVERIKELLEKLCPEMNGEFWQKVSKTKRGPN